MDDTGDVRRFVALLPRKARRRVRAAALDRRVRWRLVGLCLPIPYAVGALGWVIGSSVSETGANVGGVVGFVLGVVAMWLWSRALTWRAVEEYLPRMSGRLPICPHCGYDLRGAVSDRCSECGCPVAIGAVAATDGVAHVTAGAMAGSDRPAAPVEGADVGDGEWFQRLEERDAEARRERALERRARQQADSDEQRQTEPVWTRPLSRRTLGVMWLALNLAVVVVWPMLPEYLSRLWLVLVYLMSLLTIGVGGWYSCRLIRGAYRAMRLLFLLMAAAAVLTGLVGLLLRYLGTPLATLLVLGRAAMIGLGTLVAVWVGLSIWGWVRFLMLGDDDAN